MLQIGKELDVVTRTVKRTRRFVRLPTKDVRSVEKNKDCGKKCLKEWPQELGDGSDFRERMPTCD